MSIDQSALANPDPADEPAPEEINVAELILKLWQSKRLLVAFVLVFVVGAAIFLNRTAYVYTASLIVTPADRSTSKAAGSLTGLGSLVGIDLGGREGSAFTMHAEAIRSLPVAERLSEDPRIMHMIFAGAWDGKSRSWREPSSKLNLVTRPIKLALGIPIWSWRQPVPQDLQTVIARSIIVDEDNKRGLVRLSFNHHSPAFAKYFLTAVNKSADDFLRQKSLARSSIYILYLERRLREVQISEYRTSLSDTLGAYEKTVMMASSEASFAAESFGGVTVSPYPTSPNPKMILLFSVILATLSWVAYVLVIQNLLTIVKTAMHRAAERK